MRDTGTPGERVAALAQRCEPGKLMRLLDELSEEELAQARTWFRKGRSAVRARSRAATWQAGDLVSSRQVEALLCVSLAPPASAATWLPWESVANWAAHCAPRVARRGAAWCAEFVPAVDARRPPSDRWQCRWTYDLLRPAVDAHHLPTPTGAAYVEGWLSGVTTIRDDRDLVAHLRAEPRLDDLVAPVLEHREVGSYEQVVLAMVELAREGRLDRGDLLHRCLAGLDAPGRPGGQKVLAEVLVALDLRADEIGGGLARLQQVMATCHGSVTVRLLPLALELVTDEVELTELTTTIASRPEKKQRTDLLRALTGPALADRLPVEARRASLEILADSADAAVAARARSALAGVGGSPADPVPAEGPAVVMGLWDQSPPDTRRPPEPVVEPPTYDAALDLVRAAAAASSLSMVPPPWLEPLALGLVVRWSHREGARRVRRRLGHVSDLRQFPVPFGPALSAWQRKRLPAAYASFTAATGYYDGEESQVYERYLRESLHRAGRAPFLLSEPTHTDGSLDYGVLVERLRHSARAGFGPLDLLMAVLRVGPVAPGWAAALDGLAPVRPDLSARTSTRVPDAVGYLRHLVASGALLPGPVTAERMAAEGWLPTITTRSSHGRPYDVVDRPPDGFWQALLPVPLDDFATPVAELTHTSNLANRSRVVLRSVFPWHADLRLRPDGQWQGFSDRYDVGHHLESRGAVGPACHDLLLGGYATDHAETRATVGALTVEWIGAGRYSAEAGLAAAAARLHVGHLNLARCSAAWEQLFLAGGLRPAWPLALGVAGLAADQPRKPPGLADLLRMLAAYVAEVPEGERRLPAPLARLAGERGSTKSHAEARLLATAAAGGTS